MMQNAPYNHQALPSTGILLTNLGTPDAPTPAAVRRYLAEFLSDPRIDTGLPRWIWKLILHGIILQVRPRKTAALYRTIWDDDGGSPLLRISVAQCQAVAKTLGTIRAAPLTVALGMRYGNPSIASALRQLRQANVQRLLVLPLYPQYASATTASTIDAVSNELRLWRWVPELRFITHYHDYPAYIQALVTAIQKHGQHCGGLPEKLLFSFHGIPQRVFLDGDPYFCQCHKTARLVAESLALAPQQWQVSFQSRFGKEPWLQPYTDEVLQQLGANGCSRVDVLCPGFAADCLETLEEIAHTNRAIFQQAGGHTFHYIPALNDSPEHIHALCDLIQEQLWPDQTCENLEQQAKLCAQRAAAQWAILSE